MLPSPFAGVAIAVGYSLQSLVPASGSDFHSLAVGGVCDAVATGVVFAFSVALNNTSVYDIYWSVAPIGLVIYWLAQAQAVSTSTTTRALVATSVIVWGIRLTSNWARGWPGLHHEDWRYVDFRRKTGALYWVVSGLLLHGLPTAQVFACMLGPYVGLTQGGPTRPLDVAAFILSLAAVGVEIVADEQLRMFLATSPGGQHCASGL